MRHTRNPIRAGMACVLAGEGEFGAVMERLSDSFGDSGTAAGATDTRTRVLVIDDERLIRMTMGAKLRQVGFTPEAMGSIQEAVDLLNHEGAQSFKAIITDIMKGDMDGFVFRDIVRGLDPTIPIFFMTALDPEEGSGFLKKILSDPNSYYLPKSVKLEVLLKRVQSIVGARRTEWIIERQVEESRQALALAAHVQRSLLPPRAQMEDKWFFTTWWEPKDMVSGDLYEAIPIGPDALLYVLGDVQGHGISAALAMTAVQSFLKQMTLREGLSGMGPHGVANLLHRFFRESLADVLYMTALICVHRPGQGVVDWISCGAPDLAVLDPAAETQPAVNPEKRGALPIGMMADTVYTSKDVVRTPLSKTAVCVAHTDGILDLAKDEGGQEQMPSEERRRIRDELVLEARRNGSLMAAPYKFKRACEEAGYGHFADDVTAVLFGARCDPEGVFEAMVPIRSHAIDEMTQRIAEWCEGRGLDVGTSTRTQLVFEEKMMNLHDHGFDDRERLREVACVRIREVRRFLEMTVWDCGTPEPGIAVAAGSTDVAFDLANQAFSGRGRGRLMVRDICEGIERQRYGALNETIYYIPAGDPPEEETEKQE